MKKSLIQTGGGLFVCNGVCNGRVKSCLKCAKYCFIIHGIKAGLTQIVVVKQESYTTYGRDMPCRMLYLGLG